MPALWKRLHTAPAGALPGGIVTKIGVVLGALFCAALLLFHTLSNSDEPEGPTETQPQEPADLRSLQSARTQIQGETKRIAAQRAAAARDALRQRTEEQAAAREEQARGVIPESGDFTAQGQTEEEWKLQESLRLEEIERRQRSLRSVPLVKSNRNGTQSAISATEQQEADPQEEQPDNYLENLKATLSLLNQEAAEERDRIVPPRPPAEPEPETATGDRDYRNPTRVSQPADPPGWERIYEGSFLEGVLVTQLSGDFPGPVLAQVSVPFYSRDRQRVLIPRGARVIGTAQEIAQRDQARLAVGFHRLVFPDGRWLTLDFRGLNQVGESGLKDKVDRHYLEMFAAVGAVGVLSGLTLQGSNPYAGGAAGFRAGAGQGLGQGAIRILDRFLNRLPTITIRAGHRLRVWFTSDVLLPRPD